MMKRLVPWWLILLLSGCANPYANHYRGTPDARTARGYVGSLEPLRIQLSDNFERDVAALKAKGYVVVGQSSFNAPSNAVNHRQLREHGERIGAHMALVSSKHTHTQAAALRAEGSGMAANHGPKAAIPPDPIQHSDFSAVFLALYKSTPPRGGAATATAVAPPAFGGQDIGPHDDADAFAWNEKSIASADRGEWTEAIRTVSVAILKGRNFVHGYINRCRAYLGRGDLDEALSDCDAALRMEPQNAVAINNRGVVLARMGNADAALVDYEWACKGGYDLACENFRKVQGYSPRDAAAHAQHIVQEAEWSFAAKDWDAAIANASAAIRVWPADASAYVLRSGAYANSGRLREALDDCNAAIRLNPDDGLAYNGRGFVYELMAKPRQASLEYEIACGLKADAGCANLRRMKP